MGFANGVTVDTVVVEFTGKIPELEEKIASYIPRLKEGSGRYSSLIKPSAGGGAENSLKYLFTTQYEFNIHLAALAHLHGKSEDRDRFTKLALECRKHY
ncbi:hypothetical protein CL622_03405 [archaeon]|nr:hypothetical protein [archaeon]|tara:strand:+ start:2260 stop:2556 length:297 start_codon:yes stop_codon:yes gene_type:complete